MRIALLTVAVLALATACGGHSKKAAPPPPATRTATTTHTSTAATKTASHTSSTGVTGQTQTSRSAFASPSHCILLRSLGAKISQSIPTTFEVSRTNIAAETAALRALAGAAPSEIRGDFDTYIGVFGGYMRAFESVGLKPGRAPTKAQYAQIRKAATRVINTPGLATAEQHLKHWVRANCPKAPAKG